MLDVAIDHMVEVLACSHQTAATQKLFLNDFLRIVQVACISQLRFFLASAKEICH